MITSVGSTDGMRVIVDYTHPFNGIGGGMYKHLVVGANLVIGVILWPRPRLLALDFQYAQERLLGDFNAANTFHPLFALGLSL